MNNFLKKVLKRAEDDVKAVEAKVKAVESKIVEEIKAVEASVASVVLKFEKKAVIEEKALWAMVHADLVKFATEHGIVDAIKKTANAIIVELKKLGLVK